MELDLNILRPQERISLQVRLLYERAGFRQYHMGRFEEYGLYQENRRFPGSRNTASIRRTAGFSPASRSSPSPTWKAGCWR